MNKIFRTSLIFVIVVCSLGAGRAYYSSVEGVLSPGVVRAYPANIDEVYSDGTFNARILVWQGVEVPVRVRLAGVSPTDIAGFTSVLSSKLSGQGPIFIQTTERFDNEGVLQGTVFYGTRNGYRDVAVDTLDAQVAVPAGNQNIRIVTQERPQEFLSAEPRCQPVIQRRQSCGSSGKIDGKRIAMDILGNLLK